MTQQNSSTKDQQTETSPKAYECEECQDKGFVVIDGTKNAVAICPCVELKRYKKMIESSGIAEAFRDKSVNGFKPQNETQQTARQLAVEYITTFENIRSDRNNSIAIMGQIGAGKTHLTIAIANALLKAGIGVLYMQYREAVTLLKQVITEENEYQRQVRQYKEVPVLLIDDLYKGATRNGQPNESELRIMFEIINYRYLKKLPVIISSEMDLDKLIDFDEATGSRIAEMVKGRAIVFRGRELNHRMI